MNAFLTCVLLFLFAPGLCADYLQNYRVVVTFYRWEDARVGYNLTEATVVKQYGRRLVLSLSEPVNETTVDDEALKLGQEIGASLIESIELDSFVSVVNDPDMYALVDENASFSMNDPGLYIESQGLFQWNLADSEPFSIHAESIWKTTHGTPDVVVAVLDSGLSMIAEDMFLHLSWGYDFVSDPDISMDSDGRDWDASDPRDIGPGCMDWSEPSWHGTKVASIIAANHETMPIKGVAQNLTIMPVRVLGRCGSGYANDVADAIVWSSGGQINGVTYNPTPSKIISLSIAGRGKCPGYLQSAVNQAIGLGSVIIAAAGNDGAASFSNTFPANCVGVISVGASTRQGGLASYSNGGASVTAPGGDYRDGIYAIGIEWIFMILKPVMVSGTSVSVPHIAGLAGLYWRNISEIVNGSKTTALLQLLFANTSDETSTVLDLTPVPNISLYSDIVYSKLDATSEPPKCDNFLGVGCGCRYDCSSSKCLATASGDGWGHTPNFAIDNLVGESYMWHTATTGGDQWLRIEFPTALRVVGGVVRIGYSPDRGAYFKISVGNATTFNGANTLCYTTTSTTTVSYEKFGCGVTGKYLFYWRTGISNYFEADELTVYSQLSAVNCVCPSFEAYGLTVYNQPNGLYCVCPSDVDCICKDGTYKNGLKCSICPYGSYCKNQNLFPCPDGLLSPAGSYDVSQCLTTCTSSYYASANSLISSITTTTERQLINWVRACGVTQNQPCPGTASSTYSNDYLPAKANDGITGYVTATTYVDNCFHVAREKADEYLRFDLGVVRNIQRGSMRNRVANCGGGSFCGGGRDQNFQVYVGNDGSSPTANEMCYQDSGTNITDPLYGYCQNFTCVSSGRYVFFRSNQALFFQVGEVEIYGHPCNCPYDGMINNNGNCTCITYECILKTNICGAGTYNTAADSNNRPDFNSSNCQACSGGKYSTASGANSSDTCIQCAMGLYSLGNGSSTCVQCPAGTYSTSDFADSQSYCQGCLDGTYSVVKGSNTSLDCIACVIGSYSLGSASSTCVFCQKGTYSTSSYANSSSTCQACPSGTYSIVLGSSSSSTCIACPAGSYSLNAGSTVCLFCQAGTFSTAINATAASTCQACQSGFHSSAIGASSSSFCTACAVGAYGLGVTLSSCVNCVAGTYSTSLYAELVANCNACQIGTYSAVVGASSNATCVICANGAYSPSAALSVCTNCPTGTYSLTIGASMASSCITCVEGTYSATVGASSSGVCLNCATGSYNLGKGLSACVKCVAGTYSTSVASAALANCLACAGGYYSVALGASSNATCLSCAVGSYTLGTASTLCTLCVAGKYSTALNAVTSSNCISCLGGTYSTGTGFNTPDKCIQCATGSYSTGSGSTLCTACQAGTYSITINASMSSVCQNCSVGTASSVVGSNSSTTCITCVFGTFSTSLGASSCTSNFGDVNIMRRCGVAKNELCSWSIITGTMYSSTLYQLENLFNENYCSGMIMNSGTLQSFRIDLGIQYSNVSISFRPGQVDACGWPNSGYCCMGRSNNMKFYAGNDTSTKVLCYNSGVLNSGKSDAQMVVSLFFATTCLNTPMRYITIEGSTTDFFCVNKMYITSLFCLNPEGCKTCAAGTYQTASGEINETTFNASNCQGCAGGTYSTVIGAKSSSTCLQCLPGTYANGTGATRCITCNWGYYSASNASTACTQCQSGLVATAAGSTSCLQCLPGTYANGTGATRCIICNWGYYSASNASTACTQCQSGLATTAAGSTSADACVPCATGSIPGNNNNRKVIVPPSGASNNPVSGVAYAYYLLYPYTTDNSGGTGQTTYSLTIPTDGGDYTADILLVAGGGGGGDSMGGGGGGGGVLYKQGAVLTEGATYSIKVGNGGINGVAAQGGASDGKNTEAFGGIVYGGGGGGHQYSNLDPGNNGGCGGGGTTNEGGTSLGGSVVTGIPGTSVLSGATVYGKVGGTGFYANACGGGGGGGGAGTPGIGSMCGKAGNGGDGIPIAITGLTLYWAGGGGGGAWGTNAGNGGLGGGGGGMFGNKGSAIKGIAGDLGLNPGGTPIDTKAGSGGVSTGGGGGGTRYNGNTGSIGGLGGSGVVIVRYTVAMPTMCTPCPVGTFSLVSTCAACQAGTYSNTSMSSTCFKCPPGTYGNGSGATTCITCPSGTFSLVSVSSCTTCQAGTYSNTSMSSTCLQCPPGTYGNGSGATTCITCDFGYYSANNTSTTCTQCQSGLVTTSTGSSSCVLCPGGTTTEKYFISSLVPPSGASNNPVSGVPGAYYILFPYTTDNSGGTGQTTYSFTIPNSGRDYIADILLVAGGGGGGNSMGGGGGGGGVLYKQGARLTAGTTYSIKVGDGGINGVAAQGGASDGKKTEAFGGTVYGGGGGGHQYSTVEPGNNGGSGGGGCGASGNSGGAGGTVISAIPGVSVLSGATVYGQNGGVGYYPGFGGGGGGGGAGTAGIGAVYEKAGDGGNGIPIAITGQLLYWAGGGGGGGWYADAGNGGLGGGGGSTSDNGLNTKIGIGGGSALNPGGTPADNNVSAGSGGTSTGGGGGGARWDDSAAKYGGHGGSGVVIVRYTAEMLSMCTPCPIGTFSLVNTSTCTACQAGTYSNTSMSSTCLSCAAGTYSSSNGSTTCSSCFYDTYSDTTGLSTCISCQTGKFTQNMGSNSSDMCMVCPSGTINTLGAAVSAGGAVLSTDQSPYYVYTFNTVGSSSNITVIQDTAMDILVVGGGGSGCCGGGGGGQVVAMSNVVLSTGIYTVTVGSGGASCGSSSVGVNGGTSSIVKSGFTIQALGGGGGTLAGGGSYSVSVGNGGGIGFDTNSYPAAMSSMIKGNRGGFGDRTSYGSSGGGGGAGGIGGNPYLDPAIPARSSGGSALQCGGFGGIGVSNSFQTGFPQYYGGGGGGGVNTNQDSCSIVTLGGSGVGGNGSISLSGQGTSALPNTGGGGGGAEAATANTKVGGSGIVVIRYLARPLCVSCSIGKFRGIDDPLCMACPSGNYTPNTSSCITCPENSYCAGGASIVKCPDAAYSSTSSSSISNCTCFSAAVNTRLSSLPLLSMSGDLNMINWARSCGSNYDTPCTPLATSIHNNWPILPGVNDGILSVNDYMSHTGGSTEYVRIDFGVTRKVERGSMWASRTRSTGRILGFQIYIGNDASSPTATGNNLCYTDTGTNVTSIIYGYSQNFTCSASGRYGFVKNGQADYLAFGEVEFFGYPCECNILGTSRINGMCSCQTGSYVEFPTSTACKVCPGGSYSPDTLSCLPCPAGQYSNATNATSCLACNAGQYGTGLGSNSSSICQACDPGSYSATTGLSACTSCIAGKYQTGRGMPLAASCLSCPIGTYQTGTGNFGCDQCEAGTYSNVSTRTSNCDFCQFGTYQTGLGVNSSAYCTLCGAGKYQSGQGMISEANCTICIPGEYNSGGVPRASCFKCNIGQYQPDFGATGSNYCKSCPTGTYQTGIAMPSLDNCTLCLSGTFQTGTGMVTNTSCLSCESGKFQTGSGMDLCHDCDSGSYTPASGMSTCMSCPVDTYQLTAGATACSACPSCEDSLYRVNCAGASVGVCVACSLVY